MKIRTHRTLTYLLNESGLYLSQIKKKDKTILGKWNAYGRKFEKEKDETIEDTAVREIREESGFIVEKDDLDLRAKLWFYFPNRPEWDQLVNVYFALKWMGEGHKTEEMGPPKLFSLDDMPYDNMWDSDRIWLPKILAGDKIRATFFWKEDNKTVDDKCTKIETVDGF